MCGSNFYGSDVTTKIFVVHSEANKQQNNILDTDAWSPDQWSERNTYNMHIIFTYAHLFPFSLISIFGMLYILLLDINE